MAIDYSIYWDSVGSTFRQLNLGSKKFIRGTQYFSIYARHIAIINNKKKMQGKPMYRKRAYLKEMKNRKR